MKQQTFLQIFQNWYRQTLRHPKYRWLVIGATLFYLFSPLDISPDFLPILGWLDDGLVAGLLVAEVSQLLSEQLSSQKKKSSKESTTASEDPQDSHPKSHDSDVIEVEAVTVG